MELIPQKRGLEVGRVDGQVMLVEKQADSECHRTGALISPILAVAAARIGLAIKRLSELAADWNDELARDLHGSSRFSLYDIAGCAN